MNTYISNFMIKYNELLESESMRIHKESQILVVNTLGESYKSELQSLFPMAEIIDTTTMKIDHCIGCNSCWIKTPGRCSIKDDFEVLFRKIIKADQILFFSEEKFGMVSYHLKNIIDRMISLDMPFTCIKNGQARHAARYPKSWKFMLILNKSNNSKYLNEWMERVAINYHSTLLGTFLLSEREDIRYALHNN